MLQIFQSPATQPILCAMFGGFAIKLLELAELYKIPKLQHPDFKEWLYWIPYFVNPLLGGGLAYIYVSSGIEMQPILAVNVGVSAPLILRTMAEINPLEEAEIDPGEGA